MWDVKVFWNKSCIENSMVHKSFSFLRMLISQCIAFDFIESFLKIKWLWWRMGTIICYSKSPVKQIQIIQFMFFWLSKNVNGFSNNIRWFTNWATLSKIRKRFFLQMTWSFPLIFMWCFRSFVWHSDSDSEIRSGLIK